MDDLFMTCLQEDLNETFKDISILETTVCFRIDENGGVVYMGKEGDLRISVDSPQKAVLAENQKIEEEKVSIESITEWAKKVNEVRREVSKKSLEEITENISKIELEKKKHDLLDYLLRQKNENI